MNTNFARRLLVLCLAVMMSVSMLPAGVFAEGEPAQGGEVLTETGSNDGTAASGQNDKAGQATDQNGSDSGDAVGNGSPSGSDDIVGGNNDTTGQDDEQPEDEQPVDGEPTPAADGDSSDVLPAAAPEGPAKAPEGTEDPTENDDNEGTAAYLTIYRSINGARRTKYEGEQLSVASFYDLELELKGQFENKNQKKVIEIDIPTGWQLKEIDAMEDTPAQSGLTFGRYSKDEYKLKNVEILPVSYAGEIVTPYGKVKGDRWDGQRMPDFVNNGTTPLRPYGGKLIYTFENNAQAFELKLRLSPQQELLSHVIGSEEVMPDISIKQINGSSENEHPIHVKATNVPVVSPHATEGTYEVPVAGETTPLTIGFSTGNYAGTANNHSSGSYYDEYEYTIEFPEGVFLGSMQRMWYTNYLDNDKYVVTPLHPDHPELGGGTVTVTGKFGHTRHSSTAVNDIMRAVFNANTGSSGAEGCMVWKGGDTIPFKTTGYFIRNGQRMDFSFGWKRVLYDGSGGEAYKIRINSASRTRRDITEAYNTDKDFFLAKASLVVSRPYGGVKFYMENENDNLNITYLTIPGYNIRDLVVKTRNGKTITIPDQPRAAATKYTSTGIDLKSYGLEEGDYFSSCTFVVGVDNKIGEYGNSTTYFRGGFAFAGKFRQDVETDAEKAGQVNIYALNMDTTEFTKTEDGDLVDKNGKSVIAVRPVDPETGVAEPIKGYARVTPGTGAFGFGMVTNYVDKKTNDDPSKWSNHKGYYPNERLYFGSSYQVATEFATNSANKESTLIDPVITISLPEGLELDLGTVQLYSSGGNHGAEWFNARFLAKRTIDVNGTTWNCYDYTSPEKFDVVTPELRTGASAYFRFQAVVLPTCPRYELNTNTCILWSPGEVWDKGKAAARDSAGTNYADSRNRMGKNTDDTTYYYLSNSVAYYVYPIIGLNLDLAISTEENPDKWFTYAGIESTVATVQEDRIANVKLSYESTSESDFYKNTYIYLPIPKTGQANMYMNNTILGAPDPTEMADKTVTPKFSMDLTGPVTMTSENGSCQWETEYAISTTPNDVLFDNVPETEKDKWEPVKDTQWVTKDQITDWSKVVMVRFRAIDEIAPGEKGNVVLPLKVDKNAEFDELDYWRGYGKASLGANTNNWRSTSIVAATPSSATFLGQMFVDSDMDAAFDTSKGDKNYTDQKYSAVLEHLNNEGTTVHAYTVEVGADGSLTIDNDGHQQFLHKGDYRLTVTKGDDEDTYVYEKVESSTASSESGWYNDIKNANISGAKATHTFKIDKSVIDSSKKKAAKAESTVKPAVYYTGVGLAKLNDFSFTKLGEVEDAEGNAANEPLADAKFALYTDKDCTIPALRDGTAYKATSDADGKVEFNDIVAGTYYMKETALPSGTEDKFFNNTTTYKVVVDNEAKVVISVEGKANPNTGDITGSQEDGYSINNRQKTSFDGIKIWNDGGVTSHSPITVNIIAEGATTASKTVEVIFEGEPGEGQVLATETADGWTFTVDGLNKFKDGAKITYKIAEEAVEGYIASTEGNTITNTKKTKVTVNKVWNIPAKKAKPASVTVKLLKKGSTDAIYTAELKAPNWTYTFGEAANEPLPAYDEQGALIEYTVEEVEVAGFDSSTGEPVVDPTTGYATVTVTNSYAAEGTLALGGLKKLDVESGKLVPGQFKFKVTDNGTEIATGTNDEDGKITFTPATVTYKYNKDKDDTGDHEIVISETGDDGNGVTTENAEDVTVSVEVKDNGDKTLAVTPADITNDVTITNSYEATGSITFSGKKTIEHRPNIKEGEEFKFTVTENGETVATGVSDAEGNINFTEIVYTLNKDKDETGTHTYTVTEDKYNANGVTNDEQQSYEVTVVVEDNGNGTLKVTPSEEHSGLNFVNPYKTKGEIIFSGKKTLQGETLKEGQFSFELYDSEGKLIEKVYNKADGSYSFSALSFTGDDLDKDDKGNYVKTTKTYKVVETKGTNPQITYDSTVYNITATLTDDEQGTIKVTADPAESSYNFTNIYTVPDDPDDPDDDDDDDPDKGVKTGDDNNLKGWVALLLIGAAGVGGTAAYRRRRRKDQ